MRHTGAGPTNLVLPPTTLIGRQDEIATIRSYLASGTRLITLTGAGGIGKTRLGLEAAATLRDDFPDGVWLVELAPLNDASLVGATIAQTLHIQDEGGHTSSERLRQVLRDQHLLLLLDNFEHVLAAAPLIADLLSSAPHIGIVVTSRSRLHLRGEQVIDVPPLAVPPLQPSVAQGQAGTMESDTALRYDAVRYFVARAQAARADFALTNAHAEAIATLCMRLDGLPLALELAAARVTLLSPQEILERLATSGSARLKLLVGGARDLPARQRTLRATIEWSFSLLDPAEQRLFTRLAVFVGGCTVEAIEAICGDGGFETLDALQSLLTQSLLRQVIHPAALQPSRLTMLETIREYAQEQLEASGAARTVRHAHAMYFLGLAEASAPELSGPAQHEWMLRLDREHDNLRAALEWGLTSPDPTAPQIALRMAVALTDYWKTRGYPDGGHIWWQHLLATTDTVSPTLRARAFSSAGTMAWSQSDFEQATAFHTTSLTLSRENGDTFGIATALHNLGAQAMEQGTLPRALPLLAESLELRRAIGDTAGMAETLNNLGVMAEHEGDYTRAAAHYQESLTLARVVGHQWVIAMALANLGEVAQHQRDYARATSYYEASYAVVQTLDHRPLRAALLQKLGNLATIQGIPERAIEQQQAGLALWRQLGNTLGIVTCLEGLAAAIASSRPTPERDQSVLWLWSAAEAQRTLLHAPLPQLDAHLYAPYIQAARARLGEARCATAVQTGKALPFAQIVAHARQLAPSSPEAQAAPPTNVLTNLSERELEVLRLVAAGLTDKGVADRLVISPRTVHAHLASIYSKLGVNSRHAATRIALEHHLV